MNETPFTIKIDETERLLISLSEEQMKDLAQQVAEILKEKQND